MKLHSLVLYILFACTMQLFGMNGVDEAKVAEFKAVLTIKDCKKIHDAVVELWPWNTEGVCLKLGDDGSLEIKGLQLTSTTRACGEALREFFVKDILFPVARQEADIGPAIEQINILAGKTDSKTEGVFGYGEAFTPQIIKLSLCRIRNIDPAIHNVKTSDSMHEYEEAQVQKLILHINQVTGATPSTKGNLFALIPGKTVGICLLAVALLGGIYYYWTSKSDAQDKQDDEDTEEIAHDKVNINNETA